VYSWNSKNESNWIQRTSCFARRSTGHKCFRLPIHFYVGTEPSSFKAPKKDASGTSCFHGSAAQPSMSIPPGNWSVTWSMFPISSFTTSIRAGIRRMGGIIRRIKRFSSICTRDLQMAVLAVDESFKCFRFKKEANTYAQYQCVSQMPRTVNSLLNKQVRFACNRHSGTNSFARHVRRAWLAV